VNFFKCEQLRAIGNEPAAAHYLRAIGNEPAASCWANLRTFDLSTCSAMDPQGYITNEKVVAVQSGLNVSAEVRAVGA
jgi:hypothetical protein